MRQASIQISFEEEKLKALQRYLSKKDLHLEEQMLLALRKLYEKHVPAAVREYLDDADGGGTDQKSIRPRTERPAQKQMQEDQLQTPGKTEQQEKAPGSP